MVKWSYSLTSWRQRKKRAVPMRSSAALVCQGRATDQCRVTGSVSDASSRDLRRD